MCEAGGIRCTGARLSDARATLKGIEDKIDSMSVEELRGDKAEELARRHRVTATNIAVLQVEQEREQAAKGAAAAPAQRTEKQAGQPQAGPAPREQMEEQLSRARAQVTEAQAAAQREYAGRTALLKETSQLHDRLDQTRLDLGRAQDEAVDAQRRTRIERERAEHAERLSNAMRVDLQAKDSEIAQLRRQLSECRCR